MSWDMDFERLWAAIHRAGVENKPLKQMTQDELYTVWLCLLTARKKVGTEEWRDIYLKDMYAQKTVADLKAHVKRWQKELEANPFLTDLESAYHAHMAHLAKVGRAQYTPDVSLDTGVATDSIEYVSEDDNAEKVQTPEGSG